MVPKRYNFKCLFSPESPSSASWMLVELLFISYEKAVQMLTFVVLFRSMHTVNWQSWGMLVLARDTYF